MKKIFGYILTAALGLASLASCHQDLNIVYDNKLTKDIMWQDPSDLEQSVPAMYSLLRGFLGASERNVFYLGEIRVGDYMWGPSLKDKVQDNFKIACRHNIMNPSNTIGWGSAYNVIDQANAVLMHATDCNASEADVNAAYAQAYFARAFTYFYAVRIWGEIPLNLKPVESTTQPECYPEQATAAQVYEQIGKDIEAAEACGDVLGSDKYLGTKDALMMLKAEYALWMYSTQNGGDAYLDMAESALNTIGISSSKLLPSYGKIFDRSNRKNAEVIFAMNNTSTATAGYRACQCSIKCNTSLHIITSFLIIVYDGTCFQYLCYHVNFFLSCCNASTVQKVKLRLECSRNNLKISGSILYHVTTVGRISSFIYKVRR